MKMIVHEFAAHNLLKTIVFKTIEILMHKCIQLLKRKNICKMNEKKQKNKQTLKLN